MLKKLFSFKRNRPKEEIRQGILDIGKFIQDPANGKHIRTLRDADTKVIVLKERIEITWLRVGVFITLTENNYAVHTNSEEDLYIRDIVQGFIETRRSTNQESGVRKIEDILNELQ